MTVYRARWVLPISSPPIENGFVAVEGERIAAVGPADDAPTGQPAEDLGNAVLLPGLINAHTHLELGAYAGRLAPGPLWPWLEGLIDLRRAPGTEERERAAVVSGAGQSLRSGVTCVADISRTGLNVAALAGVPIRKVCYLELISGAPTPPADPDDVLRMLRDCEAQADDRTILGISPHSFYTVGWDDLRRIAAIAAETDRPITMHVAETRDELRWLDAGGGAVADFLSRFDLPNAHATVRGGYMDLLHRCGLAKLRPLLAHVNYTDSAQQAALAASHCSVAYCPRAHLFFGHAPHPWRSMLAAGINVCVGTDSLAGNASLSIRDELRVLRESAPDLPSADLVALATIRAARALGLDREIGSLHSGMCADMLALCGGDVRGDPHDAVMDAQAAVRGIWVAGANVFCDGA